MFTLLLMLVALLLIAACGVFVAAEFALITVNRATVDHLAAKGDRSARGVAAALATLSTQLSGAQVGITITNLALGFIIEPTIAAALAPSLQALGLSPAVVVSLAALIGLILATILTMVFGELIPKNLALARPLGVARAIQAPQRAFSRAMKYPIKLLNGSANALLRRFNIEPQEQLASARSADELSSLVRRSAEKGTLPKETALMLERSLAFDELTVLDVMTPRVRMRTVQQQDTVSAVTELARATGLSRFPVTRKSLDDIVGIIHIKQAVGVPRDRRREVLVEHIMQPPILVPSSISLDTLLEKLRRGGLQMAVVIDEFGGTDGLVTIEDLLEELVGEVQDEHDRLGLGTAIRKRASGGWVLSGLLRPDKVGEELGIFLPEEDEFETIGGLVAHHLERVPRVGDTVSITALNRAGHPRPTQLKVERMDGRRVDRIHMALAAAASSEEAS